MLFVAIAGNIGSGKSSLTRILSEKFAWKPYFESVEDNPYLEDFYNDMKRWSFHLQVYFLSRRFKVHKNLAESRFNVVQDRSIYEDAEIFAKNLYNIGKMDDRDYKNYVSLYNSMAEYLRPPDLLIYLKRNIHSLRNNISLRGREYEQAISEEYLSQLNRLYNNWINEYSLGPILTINTDGLDFVKNVLHKETLLKIIKERTASQFDLEL